MSSFHKIFSKSMIFCSVYIQQTENIFEPFNCNFYLIFFSPKIKTYFFLRGNVDISLAIHHQSIQKSISFLRYRNIWNYSIHFLLSLSPFFSFIETNSTQHWKKEQKMNQNRMVQNVLKSFTTSMDNIYKGSRRKKKTQTRHRH